MTDGAKSGVAPAPEARKSLVDVAEDALRPWLATGRHRSGERLPPEQELSRGSASRAARCAPRCGASRRAARSCAARAAARSSARPASWTLDEGLEKLVSYSELARRRGVTLEVGGAVDRGSGGSAPSSASCSASTPTPRPPRSRACCCWTAQPGARMRDVVHPDMELPAPGPAAPDARARADGAGRAAQAGRAGGVRPRTHVMARVLTRARPRRHRAGRDRAPPRRSRSST